MSGKTKVNAVEKEAIHLYKLFNWPYRNDFDIKDLNNMYIFEQESWKRLARNVVARLRIRIAKASRKRVKVAREQEWSKTLKDVDVY